MSLCTACREVLYNFTTRDYHGNSISIWRKGWYLKPHEWETRLKSVIHMSWKSFVTSLKQDCPICWTIWRYLRTSPIHTPNIIEGPEFHAIVESVKYDDMSATYELHVMVSIGKRWIYNITITVWKTTEECFKYAERKHPVTVMYSPVSAANLARLWIKNCDRGHPSCIRRGTIPEDSRTPTRLLDLGINDSNTWHVVETQDRVAYIALSHRWSENTPRLLRSNYSLYCLPQADYVLPRDYQDIIYVCRAMQIRYLWIDSLCIIQDDVDGLDFRREAPLMMDIYQHAFLTLTICWDTLGDTIFPKRKSRSIPRPPWVHHSSFKRCEYPGPLCAPGEFAFVESVSDFKHNVTRSPINSRGWVLQERCLSRRILYLSNDQLYWECDGESDEGLVASEVAPDSTFDIFKRQSIHPYSVGTSRLYWSAIVEEYTRRHLTYEQDRLAAIAGLARMVAKISGETYLAGIWLEHWMEDISWTTSRASNWEPDPKRENINSFHSKPGFSAPSWSWLVHLGAVDTQSPGPELHSRFPPTKQDPFRLREDAPLAMLIASIITPPQSDPFSSFYEASLRIKCLLIPVESGKSIHLYPPGCSISQSLTYDDQLRSVGWDLLRLGYRDASVKQSSFEIRLNKRLDPSMPYFFLPLRLGKWSANDEHKLTFNQAHASGLVVQETLTRTELEFHRVGVWTEKLFDTPQMGPMISNTIVKMGIGIGHISTNQLSTPEEREFEHKLGDFATTQSSGYIFLHQRGANREMKVGSSDSIEDELGVEVNSKLSHGKVKCSLLPYFSMAQWVTISLV